MTRFKEETRALLVLISDEVEFGAQFVWRLPGMRPNFCDAIE